MPFWVSASAPPTSITLTTCGELGSGGDAALAAPSGPTAAARSAAAVESRLIRKQFMSGPPCSMLKSLRRSLGAARLGAVGRDGSPRAIIERSIRKCTAPLTSPFPYPPPRPTFPNAAVIAVGCSASPVEFVAEEVSARQAARRAPEYGISSPRPLEARQHRGVSPVLNRRKGLDAHSVVARSLPCGLVAPAMGCGGGFGAGGLERGRRGSGGPRSLSHGPLGRDQRHCRRRCGRGGR